MTDRINHGLKPLRLQRKKDVSQNKAPSLLNIPAPSFTPVNFARGSADRNPAASPSKLPSQAAG